MTLFLGLLLAAAPPAGPSRSDDSDPATLRRWYESGRCLVAAAPKDAEAMLDARPGSNEMLTAFTHAEVKARCFEQPATVKAKLHHNATRGAIVEALLLRDFSAIGAPRSAHRAAIFPEGSGSVGSQALPDPRGMAYLALAECVVRADQERSFAVFATLPGSPEEAAAVRALVPALSQCIRPGEQVPLLAPVVRSYLAEAAYRVCVQRLDGART